LGKTSGLPSGDRAFGSYGEAGSGTRRKIQFFFKTDRYHLLNQTSDLFWPIIKTGALNPIFKFFLDIDRMKTMGF